MPVLVEMTTLVSTFNGFARHFIYLFLFPMKEQIYMHQLELIHDNFGFMGFEVFLFFILHLQYKLWNACSVNLIFASVLLL